MDKKLRYSSRMFEKIRNYKSLIHTGAQGKTYKYREQSVWEQDCHCKKRSPLFVLSLFKMTL